MDAAGIKGTVDRLTRRGLVETRQDPEDGRRLLVAPTDAGRALTTETAPRALAVSEATLAPLDARERAQLQALLTKPR